MYCDNLEPLFRVKVHKLFTISFHEKYSRKKTNTDPKDENYIVDVASETVQMMLEKSNAENRNGLNLILQSNHPTGISSVQQGRD